MSGLLAWPAALVAVLVPGVAHADAVSNVHQAAAPVYQVTFAARTCAGYTDIMANRARNNIQQSLRDLGKDSVYAYGQQIDPAIEAANNPACRPLTGWQFTTGGGFGDRVNGLTAVTGPDAPTPPTAASVPLLDRTGRPTGQTLAGAVTVTLTQAQLGRVSRGWLTMQGGTPAEPLLGGRVPGGGAFGTIRCSGDNNNADNVEYVDFPAGYRHVFCFGYYIDTRVPEGTIVVRKQVTAGTGTETFGFGGNVSYARGGAFNLRVEGGKPAETRFTRAATRAGDPLWRITEDGLDGWTLESLACAAPGGSAVTVTGGQADIRLVAGDTVTCTYTNRPPTVTGLVLRKTSTQTTGTFALSLSGQGITRDLSLTTKKPDVTVSAEPITGLPAGTYTLTETVPGAIGLGPWRLDSVHCNGVAVPVNGNSATVTLTANANMDCHVHNSYNYVGSLTLNLVTEGGTGRAAFNVTPMNEAVADPEDNRRVVSAETTAEKTPVTATGDPLDPMITTSAYLIDVTPPLSVTGHWYRTDVSCSPGAALLKVAGTFVTVNFPLPTLHIECTFTYRLLPAGTLQVVKLAEGPPDARSGPAIVDISCTSGAGGQVVLPAGQPGPAQLPEPIRAIDPATCTVTETSTGAAAGAVHSLTASPADYANPEVGPGRDVVVTLTNRYDIIPVSGNRAGMVAGLGGALVLLGAVLVALARRYRH
ncbi:prealbumin-like fold domain-containing protein [Longispora albida]|uniref:prealbumin-like fold domain-containing protein n=1 Tax=Longispora albida TaxID=203523 RepID=UPI00037FCCE0|nr:DUF5979 domain-containing protein [Longispora albida]